MSQKKQPQVNEAPKKKVLTKVFNTINDAAKLAAAARKLWPFHVK